MALKNIPARLLPLALLMCAAGVAAQPSVPPADSLSADTLEITLDRVVVTATRSALLGGLAVPADVLTSEDAEARGALRLSDLLADVGGYRTVSAFGTGVQVQGLGPDYTLVLLDGEPVIGRASGTLDLGRLVLDGVERVEVLRGPFSSLYGSDALAGVVNLISETPQKRWEAEASGRLESNETSYTGLRIGSRRGDFYGGLSVSGLRSGGYDLDASTPAPTTPSYTDYTAGAQLGGTLGGRTAWRLRGRVAQQDQRNALDVSLPPGSMPLTALGLRTDWSAAGDIERRFGGGLKGTLRLYTSRFQTETDLAEIGKTLQSRFDQRYHKAEAQGDWLAGARHLVSAGAGVVNEGVEADRLGATARTTTSLFAFAQEQWLPSELVEVTASARFDAHPDYASRLSPKLAVLVKPIRGLRLRASLGSGFKAPTFQQRYLDFTNAAAGYSVFGANDLEGVLAGLQAEGVVTRLEETAELQRLRAERSRALNVGFDAAPSARLGFSANAFYNRVEDLIEIAPVAELNDGRQVYSYFNLDRVRTRGLELGATVAPLAVLAVSARYQYLDADDLDALDAIAAGTVFRRDADGRDRALNTSDYGGLFARSRHSGSLEVRGTFPALTVSLRGTYRSRYGDYDRNGNLVLDDASEYVRAAVLLDATATYAVTDWLAIQGGIDNLLDYTDPARVPSESGRRLFAGLRLRAAAD